MKAMFLTWTCAVVAATAAVACEEPTPSPSDASHQPSQLASAPADLGVSGANADVILPGADLLGSNWRPDGMITPGMADWSVVWDARISELDRRLSHQEAFTSAAVQAGRAVLRVVFWTLLIGFACWAVCRIPSWLERPAGVAPESQFAPPETEPRTRAQPRFDPMPPPDHLLPSSASLSSPIPRVRFFTGVIDRLAEGINASRRQRGDVETGFALVGHVAGQGDSRVIVVTGLIDEGPHAERSSAYHLSDREYQQGDLEVLQMIDHRVMFLGDAHLHPGSLDTCSTGDYATDSVNARVAPTRELVFVIATLASEYRTRPSSDSLYRCGLKFDFYYLGHASDFQYSKFRPDIVDGRALTAPEPLRRFAQADPVRARLDFDNLHRLVDYEATIRELPEEDAVNSLWLVMHHKTRGFKTMIAFSADPRCEPEIYVHQAGKSTRYRPVELTGPWPDAIWFTPLVLAVERAISDCRSVGLSEEAATAGRLSSRADAEIFDDYNADAHPQLPAVCDRPAARRQPRRLLPPAPSGAAVAAHRSDLAPADGRSAFADVSQHLSDR